LLLDALREAENRHRRAEPPPVEAPATLTLSEDEPSTLASAPQKAPRAAAAPPATTVRAAPEPASLRTTAGSRRTLLLGLLSVTALSLGGAYYHFTATPNLPRLPPALTANPARSADTTEVKPTAATATPAGPVHAPREPGSAATPSRREPAGHVAADAHVTPGSDPVLQPGHPSPLVLARAALRAGDLAQAESLYRQTLTEQPDQTDAHLGLALIEQSRGELAAAASHYRAVLAVNPFEANAWAGWSDMAGDGDLEAMESQLRSLLTTHPAAALHFALGNVLAREARWADAQQSYYAAASTTADNADYAYNLAIALDHMGKSDAAASQYARSLTLARDGRAVQFDQAVARHRLEELPGHAP
jgi:Flp pilus assembly protein TadD